MQKRRVKTGSIALVVVILMLGARVMRAQTLYVLSCRGGSGVNVFARDGSVLKKLIPLGGLNCTGMAVDKAGRFYVGFIGGHDNVRIYEPDGKYVGAWSLGIGVGGIATGPDGKIYVAGNVAWKSVIKSFNPDGSPGGLVIDTGIASASTGIAVDSAGNIYLATLEGLSRYDSAGKPIGKMFTVARDSPRCVAAGTDGKYYAGYMRPVATFLPNGTPTTPSMKANLVGSDPSPTTITVGKDGKIYVGYDQVTYGRGMVMVFTPDGQRDAKAILTGELVKGIYVQ